MLNISVFLYWTQWGGGGGGSFPQTKMADKQKNSSQCSFSVCAIRFRDEAERKTEAKPKECEAAFALCDKFFLSVRAHSFT